MKARSIVGGLVEDAWKIVVEGHVAMVALVKSLEAKEGSRRFRGGGRAFALPVHSAEVVSATQVSAFANVETLAGSVSLDDAADEFEVSVGDGAPGVLERGKLGANALRKWHAPDDRARR